MKLRHVGYQFYSDFSKKNESRVDKPKFWMELQLGWPWGVTPRGPHQRSPKSYGLVLELVGLIVFELKYVKQPHEGEKSNDKKQRVTKQKDTKQKEMPKVNHGKGNFSSLFRRIFIWLWVLVRMGKTGSFGSWSRVLVYCNLLPTQRNNWQQSYTSTIHYDSAPRPQRSCFAPLNWKSQRLNFHDFVLFNKATSLHRIKITIQKCFIKSSLKAGV